MLTLTRKQYEIEEEIQLNDENGNLLYNFKMQITPDEMKEIKDLIFNEKDVKNGRKLSKLETSGNIEEYEELEAKVLENAKERQEKFERICFKEHRDAFKMKAGEYKYLEMVDMLFNFFVETFANQQIKQINIMNTHLKKITNN